ncbi:hypothetical protein [Nocardia sp. NPDC057455]|uniref:hypothetical protein n=1 Tax=Nocardia sp. NPDC057455 TaxID=3346138 RepID=UPI00366CEFDF
MTTNADPISICSVHDGWGDLPPRKRWKWGWVAVDLVDARVVAIATAHEIGGESDIAVVRSVYTTRPGDRLGRRLLAAGRDELAAADPPIILYRSGMATPADDAACRAVELPLLPPKARELESRGIPYIPYSVEDATEVGKLHLAQAARFLGLQAAQAS